MSTQSLSYSALLLLLILLISNGCTALFWSSFAVVSIINERRTTGTVIDDQIMSLKIHDAISKQITPENQINTTSYNHIVLLTGTVTSETIKVLAERIAYGINPRPKKIYNELLIGPPIDFTTQSNDVILTTTIKTLLIMQGFDPIKIKITTENSIVYIMGLLTKPEGILVSSLSSRVDGVKQVITFFEYN